VISCLVCNRDDSDDDRHSDDIEDDRHSDDIEDDRHSDDDWTDWFRR
jgi:hypothetical protein